jgi:predicted DNA-binding protein (UPF0251 family)
MSERTPKPRPKAKRKRVFTTAEIARLRAQYAVAPDEAGAIVGVDRSTIYRHIMSAVYAGRIQSLTVGACRRIVVESLIDFRAKHGGAT